MTWMPSWKALPTHKLTQQVWTCQIQVKPREDQAFTIFSDLPSL